MENNFTQFLTELRDLLDKYISSNTKVDNFRTLSFNSYKTINTDIESIVIDIGGVRTEVSTDFKGSLETTTRLWLTKNGISYDDIKLIGRSIITPNLIDINTAIFILGTNVSIPRPKVYIKTGGSNDISIYGSSKANYVLLSDIGLGYANEIIDLLNSVSKVDYFGFNGSDFNTIHSEQIAEILLSMAPGSYADLRGMPLSNETKDLFNQWNKIRK